MSRRPYPSLRDRLLTLSFQLQYDGVPGPCWIWLGAIHKKGYGTLSMRVKGKRTPRSLFAHRVSFEEFRGVKLTRKQTVDHTCECPACINPDHHQVVTRKVNSELAWARRRERSL
jgi:hypothetical protein